MSGQPDIKHIPHRAIDKGKWDRCIEGAGNGLLYAYSFYLDIMSKNWDALVLNDYESVMPLTWNEKFGIRYLYQPFLAAQLGVFGNNLEPILINQFLQAIPSSFRFVDISLNARNNSGFPGLKSRANYVLDLNKPYATLADHYSENIKRNIKKAKDCTILKNLDGEKVIELAMLQMKAYGKEEKANTERFRKLYNYLHQKDAALGYGVSLNDKLLASAIFLVHKGRAYYILVGNHPDGKNSGASHALIDGFIRDHADQEKKLDFEGSDIPGLASFYKSFGAEKEIYPSLKINRLPLFLRWMKT